MGEISCREFGDGEVAMICWLTRFV
ncbi:hypothetical protein CCACVL1_04564 [Corchorus capsularis]|uniref:Uncharacterized protein n=1 Tax=Corchorus capsularis TaxID=210143 RepID=A0A1R3JRE9_COCAP|nr:hypothetical protein CCACVL1_04564 [Corchorus capsularis]